MIEVEKMVKFEDTAAYEAFMVKLADQAVEDLGENDTENIFYLGDGFQLKVARLLSKNKAKLALKPRELGADFSHEIEVHFSLEEAADAERMMDVLLAGRTKLPTAQKRHDYLLDGVEIAAKHSDDWGYHAELEVMVEEESKVAAALWRIEEVAKRLGVRTMTKEEAAAHIKAELARKGVLQG